MRFPERLYQVLLTLYPRRFLTNYKEPLEQAFRDQLRDAKSGAKSVRFWRRMIVDLVHSIPAAHVDEKRAHGMNISNLLAYLFCLAAMFFLGRFELHTEDAGVEVFFLLLMTFILGCLHPKRAWLWGLAGLCIPAADLVWRSSKLPDTIGGFLALPAFVLVIGFVGSYSGALLRSAVRGLRA